MQQLPVHDIAEKMYLAYEQGQPSAAARLDVHWHSWTNAFGRSTGVLEISTKDKRIWSVPSLWGCPVGCTFCISSSQAYAGPISAQDLADLLDHVRARSQGSLPVELSFTGEGEAVLNVDNVLSLVEHVRAWPEIDSARVCVSGLKMERAQELAHFPWSTRLQCSLHSAVQSSRSAMIAKSLDVESIWRELVKLTPRFASVDLNVVLQPGVNDSDAHLRALLAFAHLTPWRVVFNPHMLEGAAVVHPTTEAWMDALRAEGIASAAYRNIGQRIVETGIYKKLTFVRCGLAPIGSLLPSVAGIRHTAV